jgi:hypothetical protein
MRVNAMSCDVVKMGNAMQPALSSHARRKQPIWAGFVASLVLLLCVGTSRPARAELYTGLDAAFTMDALLGLGSVVAIAGNAVTLAQKKPQRGWMYAGFIFGAINLAMGPIIIVYGRGDIEPVVMPDGMRVHGQDRPDIGYGLGLAHTALAVTSLALSIKNAVLWHRLRLEESKVNAEPVASRTFSNVQLAPLVSRDLQGGALVGLVVTGQTF